MRLTLTVPHDMNVRRPLSLTEILCASSNFFVHLARLKECRHTIDVGELHQDLVFNHSRFPF